MTQTFTGDREEILTGMRERSEQMLAASRRTRLELTDAMEQTLGAVADAQDKLAETSELEWLTRLLKAQACFTRTISDASSKFARDLLET
jgi:hypothetical protein